jgi:hypothetical protein
MVEKPGDLSSMRSAFRSSNSRFSSNRIALLGVLAFADRLHTTRLEYGLSMRFRPRALRKLKDATS